MSEVDRLPSTTEAAEEPQSSTSGLGGLLLRGAMWSSLSTAVLRLGQFVVSIVIARLISTEDFGIFVVATTVYLIVINVSEMGVSTALVREVDNADRIAPTVSTIAIANSALLAAGLLFGAPWLAEAFGVPAATDAIRVLSIPLFLAGPTAVPSALLTRDFRQGRRMVADLTNFFVGNGVLLALAFTGSGVMAMAWSRVAGQAASAIVLFIIAPRYRPGFDRREAKRLLRFGAPLAGANLAAFTQSNVDFISLGRLGGPIQLGYYNLAFTVTSWPTSIFSSILSSITVPAVARVRGGVGELKQHMAAALSAVCATAFPVTALSIVLAQPLIRIVYGAKWGPAAPILAVLAVYGAAQVVNALLSDVVVALGHSKAQFTTQMLWLLYLTPVIIIAIHLDGGRGAAIAQVFVTIFAVIPTYLVVLRRVAGVPLRGLAAPVFFPMIAAVAGGLASYAIVSQLSTPWPKLIFGGLSFMVVYLVVLGRWLIALRRTLAELYGRGSESAEAEVQESDFDAGMTIEIPAIRWPILTTTGPDSAALTTETRIPWLTPAHAERDDAAMTTEIPIQRSVPNEPPRESPAAMTVEMPVQRPIPKTRRKDDVW